MTSIFDSMIPSRRREQKRLREEEKRLRERWGDVHISAPNDGCWIGNEHTPELEWSSPSTTQDCFSPDIASSLDNNSPELGNFGEQVIIVDTEAEPSAQTYQEDQERNAITFTIPLPWPARKTHSRTSSTTQFKAPLNEVQHRASPIPSSQSPIVYKPTSDQYMKDLGYIVRGSSPASSVSRPVRHASPPPVVDMPFRQTSPISSVGLARRTPSPPADQVEGHNISAIMLLSPVVEDFPSRPKANSSFSRQDTQRRIEHFTRQLPTPPPERPSTSYSAGGRSETGSFTSKVRDAAYQTAITCHTTRSSSVGPGLERTGMMRSASREPTTRRAMSREPSERRAISPEPTERRALSREPVNRRAMSREPTERRAISREPVNRRAMSREPTGRRALSREPVNRRAMSREPARRRAMTGETVIRRGLSFEDLYRAASPSDPFTNSNSSASSVISMSDVGAAEQKVSNSSAAGGSYYNSLANEYRHIAWEASNAPVSDSEGSLVGRAAKITKDKPKQKEFQVPTVAGKELVPGGEDLYS
jgi:hypothetical protein